MSQWLDGPDDITLNIQFWSSHYCQLKGKNMSYFALVHSKTWGFNIYDLQVQIVPSLCQSYNGSPRATYFTLSSHDHIFDTWQLVHIRNNLLPGESPTILASRELWNPDSFSRHWTRMEVELEGCLTGF